MENNTLNWTHRIDVYLGEGRVRGISEVFMDPELYLNAKERLDATDFGPGVMITGSHIFVNTPDVTYNNMDGSPVDMLGVKEESVLLVIRYLNEDEQLLPGIQSEYARKVEDVIYGTID